MWHNKTWKFSIICITDKQFGDIELFYCGKQQRAQAGGQQLELFWDLYPKNRIEKLCFAVEPKGGTDGVENIVVEEEINAPVEYYNLQGVKVANPSNGIFIKVQGNKASKVLVK